MNEAMNPTFYVAAAIAILATIRAVTELSAIRALLFLIVSFLSLAVIFFILGAPFSAALEVITYAGAIMVLFVFVVMILNLGPRSEEQEKRWLTPKIWIEPALLMGLLLAELMVGITSRVPHVAGAIVEVDSKAVGMALFGRYMLGVELASVLLLSGLVGAYHLGYRRLAQPAQQSEQRAAKEAA